MLVICDAVSSITINQINPGGCCKQVPIEEVSWGTKWLLHWSLADCGMVWLLLNKLEHLQNDNDKLQSLNFRFTLTMREPENFYGYPNKKFYAL